MAFKLEPNELYKRMAWYYTQNKNAVNPENGRKALVKIANQGSSRSGKTYATIQFIYTFCNQNAGKGMYIAVLRETLVECRKFTYKDFIECFTMMGVMDRCSITEYPNPKIKIYGNTIEFMGLAEQKQSGGNNEAPRTDITFVNEIISVNNRQSVQGWIMRCEKLFIADWNPSYTDHWIFGLEKEYNTLFTRTCYLDNPHLSDTVVSSIEVTCPWDFKDSKIITDENGFKKRIWLKPERPENCSPLEYKKYRADNITNIEAGTVNRWYWLVYGEGIPAAKDGAIFDPEWIAEFPDTGLDEVELSLDFGYSADPSVLVRSGVIKKAKELYAEAMTYSSTPDVDTLFELIRPCIAKEIHRRKIEAGWTYDSAGNERKGLDIAPIVVACDSADRYKDLQFVRDLNMISLQRGLGWQFVKVKKPSITVRIALLHRFRLFVVKSDDTVKEAQNYVYDKIEGRQTNIPVDKFNHFWDALGYGAWYFYRWVINS